MFLLVLALGYRRAFSEEAVGGVPANATSSDRLGLSTVLDEAVFEALVEGACTVGICLSVWAFGRAFGVTFTRPIKGKSGSKKIKGSKVAKAVAPATSMEFRRNTSPTGSSNSSNASDESLLCDANSSLHKFAGEEPGSSPFARCTSNTRVTSQEAARGTKERLSARATPSRSELTAETDKLAAAVRTDRATELPALFDAALARLQTVGVPETKEEQVAQLLLASLRACAAKRRFSEALNLYDHLASFQGFCRPSTWSLLMWAAVEANEFQRCRYFAKQLCKHGHPNSYDFANLVRYWTQARDVPGFVDLLKRLVENRCEIDLLSRNRALAHCVSQRAFDLADAIVEHLPQVPMDPIAFNTLMKGYAVEGLCDQCFRLYTKMRSQGIDPTDITFGILLDACVDAKQLHRAREIFADIKGAGHRMNVVLYTTFIKGLVNAGELKEATGVLDEMGSTGKVAPDLVTYSTLVKAHADAGNVWDASRLLDRMIKQGLTPDSVLYNIVLTGCCAKPMDASEIRCVLAWLVSRGLRPSTATFSVLVKAMCQNNCCREALEELQSAHANYGAWPEPRVYVQFAQACSRAGQGKLAVGAYSALVAATASSGEVLPEATHSRLYRLCASAGEASTAALLRASAATTPVHDGVREMDNILATTERVVADVRRRAQQKRVTVTPHAH